MKMSNETFAAIEAGINGVINHVGNSEVVELRNSINYANDQFVAFIWQMYQYGKTFQKRAGIDLYQMVNNEGLSDSHIETALKKILAQYK